MTWGFRKKITQPDFLGDTYQEHPERALLDFLVDKELIDRREVDEFMGRLNLVPRDLRQQRIFDEIFNNLEQITAATATTTTTVTAPTAQCDVSLNDHTINGTADLQAAINALPAAGGTICVPNGIYVIKNQVSRSGTRKVRIHGGGPTSILKIDAAQTYASPILRMDDLSGNGQIVVDNLLVDCQNYKRSDDSMTDYLIFLGILYTSGVDKRSALINCIFKDMAKVTAGEWGGPLTRSGTVARVEGCIFHRGKLEPTTIPASPSWVAVRLANGIGVEPNGFHMVHGNIFYHVHGILCTGKFNHVSDNLFLMPGINGMPSAATEKQGACITFRSEGGGGVGQSQIQNNLFFATNDAPGTDDGHSVAVQFVADGVGTATPGQEVQITDNHFEHIYYGVWYRGGIGSGGGGGGGQAIGALIRDNYIVTGGIGIWFQSDPCTFAGNNYWLNLVITQNIFRMNGVPIEWTANSTACEFRQVYVYQNDYPNEGGNYPRIGANCTVYFSSPRSYISGYLHNAIPFSPTSNPEVPLAQVATGWHGRSYIAITGSTVIFRAGNFTRNSNCGGGSDPCNPSLDFYVRMNGVNTLISSYVTYGATSGTDLAPLVVPMTQPAPVFIVPTATPANPSTLSLFCRAVRDTTSSGSSIAGTPSQGMWTLEYFPI